MFYKFHLPFFLVTPAHPLPITMPAGVNAAATFRLPSLLFLGG